MKSLDDIPKFNPKRNDDYAYRSKKANINEINDKIERDLLNDILGNRNETISGLPYYQNDHASKSDNGSFMSSMVQRLTKLEKKHKHIQSELLSRDIKIKELELKNECLTESKSSESEGKEGCNDKADVIYGLRLENKSLRQQIYEMETFLNDYGLIWVGTGENQSKNKSLSSYLSVDTKLLLKKLHILNQVAGEGRAKLVKNDKKQANFVFPEPVALSVFMDGIFIKRGPFRSYDNPDTQKFVEDVLDSYFPHEFKVSHPDGVVFDIADHTDMSYEEFEKQIKGYKPFGGNGRKVASKKNESRLRSLSDIGDSHLKLGVDQFLSNLPKSVIKNGVVIDIRDNLKKKLYDKDNNKNNRISDRGRFIVAETPVTLALMNAQNKTVLLCGEKPVLLCDDTHTTDITTLAIKSFDGEQTLIVKLLYTDTVGMLRQTIDDCLLGTVKEGSDYEIRSAFPARIYNDVAASLESLGLVPNGTLMLKTTKS